MELVDVVDKNDNVLKKIDRASATNSDILRCAVVFITNSKGEVLLQLRSKIEKNYPLCWDLSAGGNLNTGENYLGGAKREMFEEIGVRTKLEFVDKYLFEADGGRKYFSTLFKGRLSGKVKIDPKEVSKVKFFSVGQIKKMVTKGEKFHPECLFALKMLFLELRH